IRSFANTESNSNRLIISNLPESYSQADVRNLLAAYGPIKHCEFMTETDANGKIRGYAIGDYDDPIITADAIKSLNGMMIDDHTLTVKPANQVGATLANALPGAASVHVPGINLMSSTENPSNILCMMNMVASEDLNNDSDYEDIYEDIKEECEKFGEVVSLEIPRPREGIEDVPGLGKVFVEFRTLDESKKALENLSGRKFDENIVVISFFNPEKYHHRQFQ
ncbi:MAG: U2 small nuclear RNA auxiliary factor 2, partial [Paramarteilia canceri]